MLVVVTMGVEAPWIVAGEALLKSISSPEMVVRNAAVDGHPILAMRTTEAGTFRNAWPFVRLMGAPGAA